MSATLERRAFVAAEAEILKSYKNDFAAAIKAASTVGITRIFSLPTTITVELTEDVAPLRAAVDVEWGNLSASFLLRLVSVKDFEGTYSVEAQA